MKYSTALKTLLISSLLVTTVVMARGRFPHFHYTPPPTSTLSITETNSSDGNWAVRWSYSRNATRYILQESAGGSWGNIYSGTGRVKYIANKRRNGNYHYRIKACRSYACSAWSSAKTVRLQYVTPSTLRRFSPNNSTGAFRIRWTLPSSAIYTAKLQRKKGSGSWLNLTAKGRTRSFSENNLAPGIYRYRLLRYTTYRFCRRLGRRMSSRCFTRSSTTTEAAKTVSVAKPLPPLSLTVPSSSVGRYSIRWGYASGYPSGYQLQQSVNGGGYSHLYFGRNKSKVVNVPPSSYRYRIRACRGGWSNAYCSAWRNSNNIVQVTIATPSTPSLIGKRRLNTTRFSVNWARNLHEDNYKLYRYSAPYGSSSYSAVLAYSGNSTRVSQTLADGNYQYRIKACYGSRCSALSAPLSTQVLRLPLTPSGLHIANKSNLADTYYNVVWSTQNRRVTYYNLYREKARYNGSFSHNATLRTTALNSSKHDGDGHYRYKVQACNESGCSGYSGYIDTKVLALPTTPSPRIINKSNLADTSYKVIWSTQSRRVTYYNVYRSQATYTGHYGNEVRLSRVNSSITSLNFTHNNALEGKYRYRLRACNESGCSGYSGYIETKVLAIPVKPTGLRLADKANQTDGSYRVLWHSQNRRVTHYTLYSEKAALATNTYGSAVSQNTSNLQINMNVGDGDYRYRVKACNEAGCSDLSAYVTSRVLALPNIPGNLRILNSSDNSNESYTVAWGTQSNRVSSYKVYRSWADYGKSSYTSDAPIVTTGLSLIKNDGDGHYRYQVKACNESGCSGLSRRVSITRLAIPSTPSPITVPNQTLGAFNATPHYGTGLVQRINLQQSVNNGPWQMAPKSTYQGKPTAVSLTRSAYISTDTDTELARYRFRMAACNASGCSNYSEASNSISVVPPGTPADFRSTASHGNAVSGYADSDGNYKLQWQAIDDVKLANVLYRIYYDVQSRTGINNSNQWNTLSSHSPNASYQLSNQVPGDYQYRIRACLAVVGCGDWSYSLAIKVALTPAKVTTFTVPNTSINGNYVINWLEPEDSNVTHYQLEGNGGLMANQVTQLNATQLSVTINNQADGYYRYRLRACNDLVCGPYSDLRDIDVLQTPSLPQNFGGDTNSDANGYFWLRWAAPIHGKVDFYQLKSSHAPHNSWDTAIDNGKEIERSFTKADATYHYQVRACNRFKNSALNCGPATATHQVIALRRPSVPLAPTLPTTNLTGDYPLSWVKPAGTVTYYKVTENGVVIAQSITDLSYEINNKIDGTYYYRVSACNSVACSAYSAESSVHVLQTPSAVNNLNGAGVSNGQGQFTFTWQPPAQGQVSRYEIRSEHAPHNLWSNAINNHLSLTKTLTEQEGDYRYHVRACNELSCGIATRYDINVRITPTSPSEIKGKGVSDDGNYRLSWLSGSGTISHYQLQQSIDTTNSSTDDEHHWRLFYSGINRYKEITNQAIGHYNYRVRACNDTNCGDWSAIKALSVNRYHILTPKAPHAASYSAPPISSDFIGTIAGEFRVNESGGASYNVPISVAAGTAGVVPQISISYNSQGANGLLSKGWNLTGLSGIARCRQTTGQDAQALAISWSADDRFCLDGQRLLVTSGTYGDVGATYKTELDSFVTVTAHNGTTGHPDYFAVARKDGSTSYYGQTSDAKQGYSAERILSWSINRFEDNIGNGINFSYVNDSDGQRISDIHYAYGDSNTSNARIAFSYENRTDVLSAYVGGEQFVTKQRLTKITSYTRHNGAEQLLREYRLRYDNTDSNTNSNTSTSLSRLTSLTECTDNNICLPATTFTWQLPTGNFGTQQDTSKTFNLGKRHYLTNNVFADINGDGLQDLIYVDAFTTVKKRLFSKKRSSHQNVHYLINTGNGLVEGDVTHYTDNIKNPLKLKVLDYNADNHQDLLVYSKTLGWQLYLAVASGEGHWSLEKVRNINLPFSSQDIQLADINADGLADAFDGNNYWLLTRDTTQDVSSNLAYHFGKKQTVQYQTDFAQDNSQYLANDIVDTFQNCGSYCDDYLDYYHQGKKTVKAVAGDINGDGISDYLIQHNGYQLALSDNSDGSLSYKALSGDNTPTISDHELVRFVDINHDGLSDLIYWSQRYKTWQAQLSTGNGFTGPITLFSADNGDKAEKQAIQLADINRDGYLDIIHQNKHQKQLQVNYWQPAQHTYSEATSLRSVFVNDDTNHIVMDYNGDGVSDYIRFKSQDHGGSFTYYSSGEAADGIWDATRNVAHVITRIDNGLGAITQLRYENINQSEHYTPLEPRVTGCKWRCTGDYNNDHSVYNDPFGDLPNNAHTLQATPLSPVLGLNGALPVVVRLSSSAPTATNSKAQSHISYYYAAGRLQASGRGSLGFKQLRTVDEQTHVSTTTTYRQDWPFIGLPWKTDVRTQAGNLLSSAQNTWALQGWQNNWASDVKTSGSAILGALQPYIAQSVEQGYTLLNNGAVQGKKLQTITNTQRYDDQGNALSINSIIKDDADNIIQTKTSINQYGDDDYSKRYGRLSHTTVTTERSGQTTKTRTASFSYYNNGVNKGLLKQEIAQGDGGQTQQLTQNHYYDDFGNKTHTMSEAWDGNQNSQRYSVRNHYDELGRYVTKQTHQYPIIGEQLVSQIIARNAYGSATTVADNNGNRAYRYYSAMGRNTFNTSDAGGWQKTWLASADNLCPIGTAYTAYQTSATGAASRQCFDVLARNVRKLQQGFNGNWIASDTHYDALGRTAQQSTPFYLNSGSEQAPYNTSIDNYDLLGRATRITAPDGNVSRKTYQGLTTTYINALNQYKTETKNALGELVRVTDNLNGNTTYQYDALGNLIILRDNANNTTTLTYDDLGRKTAMSDPDKGRWSYHYNAFGELIKQIDSKGQVSTSLYDTLGRRLIRADKNTNGTIAQTSHWVYDSQAHGVGKLAQVSDNNGYEKIYHFDSLGRNHQSDTTIPNLGTFSQKQTFDHLGRVFQQFDASSEQQDNGIKGLQTHYNQYGFADAIVDVQHRNNTPLTTYQRIVAMNAQGQVTQTTLGNEVSTQKHYDLATGLLTQLNSQQVMGVTIQALSYQWDDLGNLSHRKDKSGSKNLTESFTYDGLNRLTNASVQTDSGTTEQRLTYDLLGNITYKSDVGSYTYGNGIDKNNAGVHAVTKAGNTNYQYDKNGNNTRSSDGSDARVLKYSTFDKVTQITKGNHTTTFIYNPDHTRYQRTDTNKQTGASKTTTYLGNVEIIDHHSGDNAGQREYKRQLGMAIETLLYSNTAQQAQSLQTQTLHYLHKDHLGSIDVITDDLGNVIQSISFDAWGARRNATSWQSIDDALTMAGFSTFTAPLNTTLLSQITTRGFTGHEMLDDVGIIHMNGRIYDPKLGRFLQADPFIQAPSDTQSLNRYAYVRNNPLNKTDPSGYSWLSKKWKQIKKAVKKYWKVAVAIAVTYFTAGAASGWAASWGFAAGTVGNAVVAGAIAGAAGGFVGGALMTGSFKGALRGAFSGAIAGAAGGYANFGSVSGWGDAARRVGVAALGGCGAGKASGGSCSKGAKLAALAQVISLSVDQMTKATNELKLKSCGKGPSVCNYNDNGELLTDGGRGPQQIGGTSAGDGNFITESGMAKEGSGMHLYNENSAVGRFVNKISKTHDYFNSDISKLFGFRGYDSTTGLWLSGTETYNTMFQVYSFAGMLPAGMYTSASMLAPYPIYQYNELRRNH